MKETANDVLKYLTHLKDIKKSLGNYYFYQEDNIFIIFSSVDNLPKLSLTQKNFEIFQEIEV